MPRGVPEGCGGSRDREGWDSKWWDGGTPGFPEGFAPLCHGAGMGTGKVLTQPHLVLRGHGAQLSSSLTVPCFLSILLRLLCIFAQGPPGMLFQSFLLAGKLGRTQGIPPPLQGTPSVLEWSPPCSEHSLALAWVTLSCHCVLSLLTN